MNNNIDFLPKPTTTDAILKLQDEEIVLIKKANELLKIDINESIKIYEELIYRYLNLESYNDGLVLIDDNIFRAVPKPMALVELYYKAKMYDKCWALLNTMLQKNKSDKVKIREFQSKICSNEKKHNDALLFMMLSIVAKNFQRTDITKEEIEKKISGKIKKANQISHKDKIISVILDNLKNKNFEKKLSDFSKENFI